MSQSMLIITDFITVILYSIIILLAVGKRISSVTALSLLLIAMGVNLPLVDYDNAMTFLNTSLFMFSGIVALTLVIDLSDRKSICHKLKVISVEQTFAKRKEHILDQLLLLCIIWGSLIFTCCIAAPIFSFITGSFTHQFVTLTAQMDGHISVTPPSPVNWWHFYIVYLSALAIIIILGAIINSLKNKFNPAPEEAQLNLFLNLEREKSRNSVITEIPLDKMRKIIATGKFILARDSETPKSVEDLRIAEINEIHPIIFTSVVVDRYYTNKTLYGVVSENDSLKFYKVDIQDTPPPNNPNSTKTKEDTTIEGAAHNV